VLLHIRVECMQTYTAHIKVTHVRWPSLGRWRSAGLPCAKTDRCNHTGYVQSICMEMPIQHSRGTHATTGHHDTIAGPNPSSHAARLGESLVYDHGVCCAIQLPIMAFVHAYSIAIHNSPTPCDTTTCCIEAGNDCRCEWSLH